MARGKFEIVSKFKPAGDQPQAIEGLVNGLLRGDKYQTLLGATGTGKSVAWDEPVTVDVGGELYRGPIGALIDRVIGEEGGAETVEATPPGTWRVLAWNPQDGDVSWRRITALTRHTSPEALFHITTACGRNVRVTGSHSVWVLREGRLALVTGDSVRSGDCLPLPTALPGPDAPLRSLDLLTLLDGANLGVRLPDAIPSAALGNALEGLYPSVVAKQSRIRCAGEGVTLAVARRLRDAGVLDDSEIQISGNRYRCPAVLPVTPELCLVMGQFAAEGHASARFCLISTREVEVQQALASALERCVIPYFRRRDGDFILAATAWHTLLSRTMGTHAGVKRLPNFWPSLDDPCLGALLRGYFEGDGGVEKGGVTAVTLSEELAADITEALLRFGIWARMRAVSKRTPNGDRGQYYKITISGADNLAAFAQRIGFVSRRKGEALAGLLGGNANTNVDLVPGVGAPLLRERQRTGLLQRDVAQAAGCKRATIGAVESGVRNPSRRLFGHICQALGIDDPAFVGLGNVIWSPVAVIERVESDEPYVYDFSVDGYETFLTGRGGLFVHNTFSIASVIEKVQRPTLVIAHNKTLVAQLCSEFRDFFPNNAVEYFVSYFDYYQPEAYIPQTDTFIEKDSSVNEEINRLRHSATQAVLERRDVIVVASVSAIYGLGSPEQYKASMVWFRKGIEVDLDDVLRRLVQMQFSRNDIALAYGTFRVRGDLLELQPADEEIVYRVYLEWGVVEKILAVDPITGESLREQDELNVFPASHYVSDPEKIEAVLRQIDAEMEAQKKRFTDEGKLIEAQRIEQRTRFDMEMIRELGYCSGIENYSRWFDGRDPGSPPHTLLEYFPDDMLLILDESHQTIPQLNAMYAGDKRRKDTLIEYGFRLPSAADNRPLRFQEFEARAKQAIFVSATPSAYERQHSRQIVEQIIRPTGLIDPQIVLRPTKGQIDDLIGEIRGRTEKGERALVTTLTKKMAEDLTEYLVDIGVKVQYLHSDVHTLERSEILRDLRLGVYDVVVGINLLREGLDLPEVSLVAILDADKEGFLRSETSLIQTIGRAARNVGGLVLMYADVVTGSMRRAIDETNRRRAKQEEYNRIHGITPTTVTKAVRDVLEAKKVAEAKTYYKVASSKAPETLPLDQLLLAITEMEKEMKQAARSLDFEHAATLRDEIARLKKLLPPEAKKK